MKTERCYNCGRPIKPNKKHCICYQCHCVERTIGKDNPPRTKEREALKHLEKKGAVLLRILFGI